LDGTAGAHFLIFFDAAGVAEIDPTLRGLDRVGRPAREIAGERRVTEGQEVERALSRARGALHDDGAQAHNAASFVLFAEALHFGEDGFVGLGRHEPRRPPVDEAQQEHHRHGEQAQIRER